MKKQFQSLSGVLFLMGLVACSSTSNLRKFDDGDIGKQISVDVAKKFEVKDAAPADVVSVPVKAIKKIKKKTKVMDKTSSAPELPPMRRLTPMPFDIGEKLQYDIRYLGVTAGYMNLETLPPKEVNTHKVYHLKAGVKTVKFFELVYRVDDHMESFWDYDGLYSHRFTMDLDESKQSRKLIELYDYEKKLCFYWNRIDHSEKGFSEQNEQRAIKPWSQDILSAMYFIRAVDLPKTPEAAEVRFSVVMDGKPWETAIKFLRKEKVYANSKDYQANVYKLENYENGELKNKDNTLWLSDDQQRYILRLEAKVKVGSFAVALDKVL